MCWLIDWRLVHVIIRGHHKCFVFSVSFRSNAQSCSRWLEQHHSSDQEVRAVIPLLFNRLVIRTQIVLFMVHIGFNIINTAGFTIFSRDGDQSTEIAKVCIYCR